MTDDKLCGIYDKFRIERTDGKSRPGRKHDGCTYFVLDITHDPFAVPALLAYADSCEAEYPELAADCRRWVVRPEEARIPATCELCGGKGLVPNGAPENGPDRCPVCNAEGIDGD